RFTDECNHPAQRLFRARGRLRGEVRQIGGRRHHSVADAPLCRVDVRAVDGSLRCLENARPAVGLVTGRSNTLNASSNDRIGFMSTLAIPLDVAAAEEHLMR